MSNNKSNLTAGAVKRYILVETNGYDYFIEQK